MILQALYSYAETMRAYQAAHPDALAETGGKTPNSGMQRRSIPYRIILKKDGSFVDFRRANDELQEVPKAKPRSSNVVAYSLWDYLPYVLGIPLKSKEDQAIKENKHSEFLKRTQKQFRFFRDEINKIAEVVPEIRPIKAFYDNEEYLKLLNLPITEEIKELQDKAISFELEGSKGKLVCTSPSVIEYFSTTRESQSNLPKGRCLVTGKADQPLTRIHGKITVGGQLSGLITFQKGEGYDSYHKEQGLNAPISLEASDAIGTALKHLLGKGKETNYSLQEQPTSFGTATLTKSS